EKAKAKAAQERAEVDMLYTQYCELYTVAQRIQRYLAQNENFTGLQRCWQYSMLGVMNGVFYPQYKDTYVYPPTAKLPVTYKSERGYKNWYQKQITRLQDAFEIIGGRDSSDEIPF